MWTLLKALWDFYTNWKIKNPEILALLQRKMGFFLSKVLVVSMP